jgi:hypothetical protein
MLILVVTCLAALEGSGGPLHWYVDIAAGPLRSMLDARGLTARLQAHPELAFAVEVLFLLIVLGGPLLILPLLGGLLFRRLGITLVRRPRQRETSPDLAVQRPEHGATNLGNIEAELGRPVR